MGCYAEVDEGGGEGWRWGGWVVVGVGVTLVY